MPRVLGALYQKQDPIFIDYYKSHPTAPFPHSSHFLLPQLPWLQWTNQPDHSLPGLLNRHKIKVCQRASFPPPPPQPRHENNSSYRRAHKENRGHEYVCQPKWKLLSTTLCQLYSILKWSNTVVSSHNWANQRPPVSEQNKDQSQTTKVLFQ